MGFNVCCSVEVDMTSTESTIIDGHNEISRRDQQRRILFCDLPPELKLRVFGLLSATECGIGSQVCRDWRRLMHVSTLWSVVDTRQLPTCNQPHVHNNLCRLSQRRRICQFLNYVANRRAVVRRLYVSGDVCDIEWRSTLESFLVTVRCHELTIAQFEWNDHATLTTSIENNEQMRRAQRYFVNVLEIFVRVAPKLTTFILPFDWSDRSVDLLVRLRHLQTLILEKYFNYQYLQQSSLDTVLSRLPSLRRLHLEVWIASGSGLIQFTVCSPTLQVFRSIKIR